MQTQLEATLAKLIAIPSVTNDRSACHEIISFIKSELEPLGLFITVDTDRAHPWLIATTRDTKEPATLLAAHVDVVPAPAEYFTMQKKDGKLYGRGVYDMKFSAACYIELLKTHVDILPTLDIGVLFTTDEEVGGLTVSEILGQGWRTKRALLPDGGDDWKVEERAKGIFGVELTATGKTGHGSRPWEGDNALHKILDICHILRSEYPLRDKLDETLSVNLINGGQAVNQIADHAVAMLDFRSFDKEVLNKFEARVNELAKEYNVSLRFIQYGGSLAFDKTNPAVQDFLAALKEETGKDVAYCNSFGATDGRFFAEYDIPSIIVQTHGGSRHAADEWMLAEDLEKYYYLLERWLVPKK